MDVAWYNYLYGNFGALTNIMLPWIGAVPCDNVGRCMCSYSSLLTLFLISRIGMDLILMSHLETSTATSRKYKNLKTKKEEQKNAKANYK